MIVSLYVLAAGVVVALVGIWVRMARFASYRVERDPSPMKASVERGVAYAFRKGMLPWNKESARLHPLTYARGFLLHIGIFVSFAVLLAGLFIDPLPFPFNVIAAVLIMPGFIAALSAIVARVTSRDLRALGRPDDYISIVLLALMLGAASAFVTGLAGVAPFMFVTGVVGLYLPWSKIPHAIYFFFARGYFGRLYGSRDVFPGRAHGTMS